MKWTVCALSVCFWVSVVGCAPDYSHIDARVCQTNTQCPSGQCQQGYCVLADSFLDNVDADNVDASVDSEQPDLPEDIEPLEDTPMEEPDALEDTPPDLPDAEDASPDAPPCSEEVLCELEIVRTDPARHTATATPDQTIEITFNAAIAPGSLADQLIVRGSISGLVETVPEVSEAVVTLTPTQPLQIGEEITVLVRTGVRGVAAERPPKPIQWQYRIKPPPNEGLFVISQSPGFGHYVTDVACADFNGDGDLDLFVLSDANTTSKLLLGMGDGFFSEPLDIEINGGVHAVPGDIDNDGDIDVFITSSISPNILILNEGDGSFTEGMTFPSFDTRSGAIGDLNGDGNLDIYLTHTGNPDEVLLGDGQGGLTSTGQRIGDIDNGYIDLGDLDNDGDLDVITTGLARRLIANSGTGQFGVLQEIRPVRESLTEFGDLNEDGHLDYIMGSDGPDEIHLSDGEGGFNGTEFNPGNLGRTYVGHILDINGDGHLDAFLHGRGGARLLFGDGEGNLVDSGQAFGEGELSGGCMADLDDDGDLDAVLVDDGVGFRIHIAINRPQ